MRSKSARIRTAHAFSTRPSLILIIQTVFTLRDSKREEATYRSLFRPENYLEDMYTVMEIDIVIPEKLGHIFDRLIC